MRCPQAKTPTPIILAVFVFIEPTGATTMRRLSAAPPATTADYIGSTEGPHQIDEATADRIDEATEPAFFQDADGWRHFFDMNPPR
jgi:hypothetical protein